MALLGLSTLAHADGESRDYRPDSPAWNGLSSFLDEVRAAGCGLTTTDHVDWSQLGPRDVLFFVYPQSQIDRGALASYLNGGGRLLLADDFGAAGDALLALELRRHPARLESVPRDPRHPELPIAKAGLLTTLGRSTPEVLANHPAAFETALPATFAFSPGQALVVEGKVGRGRFVALADPSVLINNMLEVPGNRAFARSLVSELCTPGPNGDRVHLVSGPFLSQGEPRASTADAHTVFNELCTTLNRAADDAVSGASMPIGLMLCAAATAIAWRAFGRLKGPRHADGGFTRAEGDHRVGTLALVDALPRGSQASGDFSLPLALLRAEVSRRLGAKLGAITAATPRDELLRRAGAALGPAMKTALAHFLATGPRGETLTPSPGLGVSRRVFVKALGYARPILARLPADPEAPTAEESQLAIG